MHSCGNRMEKRVSTFCGGICTQVLHLTPGQPPALHRCTPGLPTVEKQKSETTDAGGPKPKNVVFGNESERET